MISRRVLEEGFSTPHYPPVQDLARDERHLEMFVGSRRRPVWQLPSLAGEVANSCRC